MKKKYVPMTRGITKYIIRRKKYVVRDGIVNIFGHIKITPKDGLQFNVREGKQGLCDVGILINCIDRDGFSYWHQEKSHKGIVIDIGAHIGGFTCAVAKTAKHVFSFEASTENYNLLVKNVELNNLKNVSCFHRIVGNGNPGKIVFCGENHTTPSTLRTEDNKTETVQGISLREIIEICGRNIGFMKIDCEGGEYDLFLNQPKDLIRCINVIGSEIHTHPDHTHKELITFISDNGYKYRVHASRADSCKMADFWRVEN